MKMITTLAATVALVVGVSIAAAQTPSKDMPSNSGKASSTQMNQTTSPSPSGGMGSQQMAKGSGKFCIQTSAGNGGLECKYASMAACEKYAKPNNRQCMPNPNLGTTGQK